MFSPGTTRRLAEDLIRQWHSEDRAGTESSDDDEHRGDVQEQHGWKRRRSLAEVRPCEAL